MALGSKIQVEAERAELGEDDVEDFCQRLDGFRDTLGEKEQVVLAVIVVEGLGGMEGVPASREASTIEPPTEGELDAFVAKLNEFHDSLPGDQHLLLDEMLGRTWFRDEAEVEGYRWVLLKRWSERPGVVYDTDYGWLCKQLGGDRVTWGKWRGDPRRHVACWGRVDD